MAATRDINNKPLRPGDTIVAPVPATAKVVGINEDGSLKLKAGKALFPTNGGGEFTMDAGLVQKWKGAGS